MRVSDMAIKRPKTRSTLYCRQMSDDVKVKVSETAATMGIAQWLVIEKILESAFGIDDEDTFDVAKWITKHKRGSTGKAYKNKR